MECINNQICLTQQEMLQIMPLNTLNSQCRRGKLTKVNRGGGADNKALYAIDTAHEKYRKIAYMTFPELGDEVLRREMMNNSGLLLQTIRPDGEAVEFFAKHITPKGENLKPALQTEYYNNAIILNACKAMWDKSYSQHMRQGHKGSMVRKGEFWKRVAGALTRVADKYPHSLPENAARLQEKYEMYMEDGYVCLLNGRFGNMNRTKVSAIIESLLLSVYGQPSKPSVTDVHIIYNEFLLGMTEIVNTETGELYNRGEFYKDGLPITLTEQAIWAVVNKPKNRRIVDARRNDSLYNKGLHTPHAHRMSPIFAFSKISMDDRDLTRKTTSGERVFAYYAYDVASGCVIGVAHSRKKDLDLVYNCFRDMFRFINKGGYGMPMEVEVEHHLMNKIENELAMMFPFVRFCQAGNSQEKRAEHLNKAKKYKSEKKLGQTVGRWWAKGELMRSRSEREGAEYKEVKLPYGQLIAEDLEAIAMHNNEMHPNQKDYKGLTRMEVLQQYINPNIAKVNKPIVYKAIGYATKTTLRRSQYVSVQYSKYTLPHPSLIERFKANNYECTAYWLDNEKGEVESVDLWQGEQYIGECKKIVKFNEARAEMTEADEVAMLEQQKYIAQYHKMNKDHKAEKIHKIKVLKNEVIDRAMAADVEVVEIVQDVQENDTYTFDTTEDWAAKALGGI